MVVLKIPNSVEPCLDLHEAWVQRKARELKISLSLGPASGVALAIMAFLVFIRSSRQNKDLNKWLIWFFFLVSAACAFAILGLFMKEGKDFNDLRQKVAKVEDGSCDICKVFMSYTSKLPLEIIPSSPDATHELPQDVLIQKIAVQSPIKPTVLYNDGTKVVDVTNLLNFTKTLAGYDSAIRTIYTTGATKLTIDPHGGSISYSKDADISAPLLKFLTDKQIIAQVCASDVVVVTKSGLVQTPVMCCNEYHEK